MWHPDRITAIVSQNGNAYEEGLSDGWNPIRAYWKDASPANRGAHRAFLSPTRPSGNTRTACQTQALVSPDGHTLDDYYLARPGADDVQFDLFWITRPTLRCTPRSRPTSARTSRRC